MRIPLSKIYRAFPEFDPFPDDECERYLRYAYRRARLRIGCIPVLVFAATLVMCATIFILTVVALGRAGVRPSEPGVVFLLAIIGIVAVPSMIALITRDRILFRVLHDRIKNARCPGCEFSLLGLPIVAGAARCPECGFNVVLREHNLTPEDLLIRRVGETDAPDNGYTKCATCGFDVRGVSITNDAVRCPDCGHVQVLNKHALLNSVYGSRTPDGSVNERSRVTECPGCKRSLLGYPIFESQARCMDCGFIANVEPGPDDEAPAESASEVGLRIKRQRNTSNSSTPRPPG